MSEQLHVVKRKFLTVSLFGLSTCITGMFSREIPFDCIRFSSGPADKPDEPLIPLPLLVLVIVQVLSLVLVFTLVIVLF